MSVRKVLLTSAESSDFPPFSSRGTHKLIAKILQHTENIFFADLTKKIGIILIHSHQMALFVVVVVVQVRFSAFIKGNESMWKILIFYAKSPN